MSKLEKYYFTVTSVLMHALILVIWGDTTTANWRESYQCYQCDFNFFLSQLLRLHTKIELCIFQALDIADVNDLLFGFLSCKSLLLAKPACRTLNRTVLLWLFSMCEAPPNFWYDDLPKTKKYWESESNQCKRCWPIRQVDGWMRTSVRGTGRSSFYCPNPLRKMRH